LANPGRAPKPVRRRGKREHGERPAGIGAAAGAAQIDDEAATQRRTTSGDWLRLSDHVSLAGGLPKINRAPVLVTVVCSADRQSWRQYRVVGAAAPGDWVLWFRGKLPAPRGFPSTIVPFGPARRKMDFAPSGGAFFRLAGTDNRRPAPRGATAPSSHRRFGGGGPELTALGRRRRDCAAATGCSAARYNRAGPTR
jgi:hypothetical protein